MSDAKIAYDPNAGLWDAVLVDGDLVLLEETETDDAEAVAQRVTFELSVWLGESPYDTTGGMPYENGIFGFGPVPGIGSYIYSKVLATEGVATFDEDPTFELADERVLNVYLPIVTVAGQAARVSLEIQPV